MTVQEKTQRKEVLKELIRDIHMPSFCDEEGRCDALDECTDTGEYDCSCCNINRVVKAFNRGIEFQKQKSPWISVEDDLPCYHEELKPNSYATYKVIVLLNDGRVRETYMFFDKWHEYGKKITHWKPFIEPPKE